MFRKLSVRFHQALNLVMGSAMGLLGFSCESGIWEAQLMYGTPTATYQLKGKVTDEGGHAVKDARVMVGCSYPYMNCMFYPDTAYTNANGEYIWKMMGYPGAPFEEEVWIKCEAPGTGLVPDSVLLKSALKDPVKWWKGDATETVNIQLKPKAENPE